MKFNKTLHPSDYGNLQPQLKLFNDVTSKIDSIIHHDNRRWEYGVALASLDLIRNQNPQTILDIGGGGSPLPAMASSLGYGLMVIDPSPEAQRQADFNKLAGMHINVDNRDFMDVDLSGQFDVVFCISTLEHVQDDVALFKKALSVAQHLAVFTVDYHVTGQAQSPHHLRTYNRASLEHLAALAAPEWELVDSPDWADHGAHVFGYNFASLVLRRKTIEKELAYSLDAAPNAPTFMLPPEPDQPTEPMDVSEAPPKPPKRKRKSKKATTDNA